MASLFMEFSIYKYLKQRPLLFILVKQWIKLNLPLPQIIKRQLANEIHAEMIARLMNQVIKYGNLTKEQAFQIHYDLGLEVGHITQEFLSLDPNNAKDLSRIIDFLHDLLNIKGKIQVKASTNEAVSHWKNCSLYNQLQNTPNGSFYCHLYQEMYKGVLHAINPKAYANDLVITRSQGHEYCELKTWISN